MSVVILKDGEWIGVVSGVPGNLKVSQILPMWLDYLGIEEKERNKYSAQWINNTDYATMRRWHEMCATNSHR